MPSHSSVSDGAARAAAHGGSSLGCRKATRGDGVETLVFGRNGSLFVRRLVPTPGNPREPMEKLLPLTEIEAAGGGGLLSRLLAPVDIEAGTPVGALLLALKPWSRGLSAICGFDLDKALAEARAPFAPEPGPNALAGLEILPHVGLLRRRLAPEEPPVLLVSWDFLGRLRTPQPDGFGGSQELRAVVWEPLSRWSGLPIRIRTDSVLVDETDPACASRPIRIPQPSFFDAIIGALLLELAFDESPEARTPRRHEAMLREG